MSHPQHHTSPMAPACGTEHLNKVYGLGSDSQVVALDDVSAALLPGSFTAIMGPSGSGKSTLMGGLTALLVAVCLVVACLASVLPGRRFANATPTEASAVE